jgi:hypothetical protein
VRVDGIADCGTSIPAPAALIARLSRYTAAPSVEVHWSARATISAIASYDVRWHRAKWNETGEYGMTVDWQTATAATAAVLPITQGYTYCLWTRARDTDDHVSEWTEETCTAAPLDDRRLTASTGWTKVTSTSSYLGTAMKTKVKGKTLTRTQVVATHLALVATTCPTCGTVRVYLGTTLLKTISLVSTVKVNRAVIPIKSWSYEEHQGTVRIKVVSDGKPVIIDGLAVDRS